jgi:hypothetical protein
MFCCQWITPPEKPVLGRVLRITLGWTEPKATCRFIKFHNQKHGRGHLLGTRKLARSSLEPVLPMGRDPCWPIGWTLWRRNGTLGSIHNVYSTGESDQRPDIKRRPPGKRELVYSFGEYLKWRQAAFCDKIIHKIISVGNLWVQPIAWRNI